VQQQQQQQQQAARQQRQQRWHTQWAAVQQLLSEVDETMLWSVYKVFGRNLERLHSLEVGWQLAGRW
jgi:hypothetical protein